ncbi:MAG TPA: hypothetical protein VLM79_07055, partial [Kofleriaceae bacterium]|nr:hypothetical protein [Kofleriaceae bacterium]
MSTSDSITSLLRDGDLARLAARLESHTASLDELAALLRHGRAPRHLALLYIERWLDHPVSAGARRDIARLLPARLDDGPEVALLLARLTRCLAPWLPGALPDWRAAGLPLGIEVEWLRTELIASPATVAHEPFGERLLQALAPHTLVVSVDAAAGLTALAGRTEPPLPQAAIAQLRSALHRSRLRPHDARAMLEELSGSPDDAVAAAALRELAEPWSLALPSPSAAWSAQLGRPGVLAAALECAARWRLEGPLRAAMENPFTEPRLRQRAMELAGSFAIRRDVPAAISIAASDPLLFGPPLLLFLRAQHRLGHFVAEEDAARLADVCLANAELPAGEIADLTFTARHAFAAALLESARDEAASDEATRDEAMRDEAMRDEATRAEVARAEVARAEVARDRVARDQRAPEDPSWVRRAELLVALARGPQGKSPLAIGAALESALRATAGPRVRRALIRAIGDIEYLDGEAVVLAHLEDEPSAALAALRSIGGRATVFAVIAAIDHVRLRPFRDTALTLAWHLSETDADLRAAVRGALRTGAVPTAIEAQLAARSTADEVARLHGVPRDATTSYFLRRVAAVAGATEWPLIGDLLLRVVSELAAGTIRHPARADDMPSWMFNPAAAGKPMQTLPDADRDALEAMGRRLYRAGCLRPRALLAARSEGDAGPLLISALARELLERSDLSDAETAILLGLLDPGVDPRVFPAIHRMLRRPEPEIRKRVVALLARDGADELLANLTALTDADDIETVRQAILAIGALGPRGGASVGALTRCLEHRNMNIKKAAAEALATAGGPAAVGRLLFWLGYHDNPGFRSALIAALRAILGDAYAATLVATVASPDPESPDEPRRQTLLLDALGGALACDDAVALCRSDLPLAAQLRDAILAGNMSLASGDRTSFAVALDAAPVVPDRATHGRAARGRVALAHVASTGTASERAAQAQIDRARALSDNGFDAPAARSLLATASAGSSRWDARALVWVRRFWRE